MDYSLIEARPGISVVLMPDAPFFTVVTVSNDFVAITGIPRERLNGGGFFTLFPQNQGDAQSTGEKNMRASFEHVIRYKQPHLEPIQRYDLLNHDGTFIEKYWKVCNVPVLGETGEVCYIIHTSEDITEHVKSKQQIAQMGGMQQAYDFFMQAPVAVCIVKGPEYVVELANEQMLQLLGRTSEMVGKHIIESLPEAKAQGLMAILNQVRNTGESFHAPNFPAELLINGVREHRYFDLVIQPTYQNKEDVLPSSIFCVAYNVTRQIQTQKLLEEIQSETDRQKRVYEAITGNTPDLIYVFDLNYCFTYANEALLNMWGKNWDEAIGRKLLENGYEPWHAEMHEREIDQVVATKQPIRGEVSFPHATLGKRVYDYIFVPVLNKEGEVEAVAGTTRDITEIKEAEQRIRQSEVELQQKVAERTAELQKAVEELKRSNANLEDFAYAASHDMKEPIRKIHFFSDRLKTELKDKLNETQGRLFERLESAAKRMGNLIDDLLTYSQATKGISELENVDLNKKIQLVLEDLELEVQQKGAQVQVVDPLPVIKGNKRQMQQLFQNLLSNALKYTKPGINPEILIATKQVRGKDVKANISIDEECKMFYLIEVKDNGIGFKQEDAERIFNVFTRLANNGEYRGTGIGLSIVRKVVENHKGYIWAESEPGKGASFKVLLQAI